MSRRKLANHLMRVNYMGIYDKIKNFKKPKHKKNKAVTTAIKTK